MLSVHHLHKRKRIHQKKEAYPSKKFLVRFLDKLVFLAAIVSAVMTLPQVWVIYKEKNVGGLSLHSWITYFVVGIIWLLYGIVHKDRAIILGNIIFAVLNFLIVMGIVIYS